MKIFKRWRVIAWETSTVRDALCATTADGGAVSLWLPKEPENACVRKVADCSILHNLIEIIIIFKCGFVVLINYKHMVCKTHAARVN